MEDEHFINWMRIAGLSKFSKLWGKLVPNDLKAGNYSLEIENTYEVDQFKGSKWVILSTTNSFGGKNFFLAYCYIFVGTACAMFSLIFFIEIKR